LVYVHYKLGLLSHYYEEAQMDKNLRRWDNNLEEDNLEDGILLLEQLESVLLDDDDDHVEMPPPSSLVVPMSRIPATTLGASSSALPQLSASTSALPPRGGPRNTHGGGRRMG
jgi:hypothetical protein